MSRRSGPTLLWASLALSLLAPSAAAAEPGDAEKKAAAQAMFDDARKLTEGGDFPAACPKFAESRRLDPTMGTTFYLADCLEHIGKLASAWTYYIEVADTARTIGQQDRETYARSRAEALKPRLSALVVAVSSEARALTGLLVQRNGAPLGEAQWGAAIPVDAGDHVVSATADGKERWEARVTVSDEGKTVTVEVPPLQSASSAAPPSPPLRDVSPAPPPPPPPAPQPSSAQRVAGIAVGAAGVVGLGIGAIFGLQAMSKQAESDADGRCDAAGTCDDIGRGLRDEAISAATISTVGFIAGGVAVAGGALLFLTAPSGEPAVAAHALRPGGPPRSGALPSASRGAPRLRIAVGPAGASLLARF